MDLAYIAQKREIKITIRYIPALSSYLLVHCMMYTFLQQVPKLSSMVDSEHFLAVLSDLCLVQCECVVGVYGVCLNPPALVMEMLPLGPLHTYLIQRKELMKEVSIRKTINEKLRRRNNLEN